MEEVECKTCHKMFTKYKSRPKNHCSVKCRANDIELKKKFTERMSHPFSKERKAKHKLAFKVGKDSDKWIKDRTQLKKDPRKDLDTQYKYWRKEIRKRDRNICKLSSSECKGRLETHHIFDWINYPELRYILTNGITLCAFHHPRGREEEKRMIPIFQELLSVSKE